MCLASTTERTLDAVYVPVGGRVQCAARAADSVGRPGAELLSRPAEVDAARGLCEPRLAGTIGAEPFTAKLKYTGETLPGGCARDCDPAASAYVCLL